MIAPALRVLALLLPLLTACGSSAPPVDTPKTLPPADPSADVSNRPGPKPEPNPPE